MRVAGFARHGLMEMRVEIGAERLDRRDAPLPQQVMELPADQLDAGAIGCQRRGRIAGVLRVRGRAERALEIVEQRQDVAEQVRVGVFAQLAAFLLVAAAVVVEFGALAEQQVLEFVALGAQLLDIFRRGSAAPFVDGSSAGASPTPVLR